MRPDRSQFFGICYSIVIISRNRGGSTRRFSHPRAALNPHRGALLCDPGWRGLHPVGRCVVRFMQSLIALAVGLCSLCGCQVEGSWRLQRVLHVSADAPPKRITRLTIAGGRFTCTEEGAGGEATLTGRQRYSGGILTLDPEAAAPRRFRCAFPAKDTLRLEALPPAPESVAIYIRSGRRTSAGTR